MIDHNVSVDHGALCTKNNSSGDFIEDANILVVFSKWCKKPIIIVLSVT
jgi:hypothetical protein